MSNLDLTAKEHIPSTPAAAWRENGEPDPHGTSYDCERAALTLGFLTDDELANGVFMNADQPMDIKRLLAKDPDYYTPNTWLTGAKERIRWLSRALVSRTEEVQKLKQRIADLEEDTVRLVQEKADAWERGFVIGRTQHSAIECPACGFIQGSDK